VRKGNPKHIKDWDDLIQARRRRHHAQSQDLRRRALELPGRVGLRLQKTFGDDEAKAATSCRKLYKNVPVLDSGARGATTTFAQRGIGDVLIAWENEAFLRSRNSARTSSKSSRPR
jgi:ABC-type sulfate transport system substrate-binding protein